jgi:hypothetical protein
MLRIILAYLALALGAAAALAASQADHDTCNGMHKTANVQKWADERIAACTRIIDDDGESVASRAKAHVNRAEMATHRVPAIRDGILVDHVTDLRLFASIGNPRVPGHTDAAH